MNTQVLNQVVCFFLDIHLWTGRKKLRPEDLKVTAGELPPEKLASLGSKKICDPSELAVFGSLKKRAERACTAVGVRFLGGYAVPEDASDQLAFELEEIKREFDKAKSNFVSQYEEALETWIADNSEWASIIRAAIEPVSTVKRRLSYGVQAFKIEAPGDDQASALTAGLETKVGNLGDRLLFEVARDAEKVWENSFRGRDAVTQKALRPIRSLLEKLRGLAFLDGRVGHIIARVEKGLSALPQNGPIEDQDFNALCGIVLMLADPDGVKAIEMNDWGGVTAAPVEDSEEEDQQEVETTDGATENDSSKVEEQVEEPVSENEEEPVQDQREAPAPETEETPDEEEVDEVVVDYDDADDTPSDDQPAFPVNWF